jgi:drug/metabolite transporter (DMT)-like permease
MTDTIHPHKERTRAILLMLFAIAIWSGWIVISSHSVRAELLATDIVALRFGLAGLLLMPVIIKKGFRIGPWGFFGSFFLACMMGAPYNLLSIYAMKYIPASHAAGIINATMLSLTTLIGVWFLREHTSRTKLSGVALSIAGIALLFLASTHSTEGDTLLGHLLVLAGGAFWSVYAVMAKKWHVDPLHATACVCVCSAMMFLPIYFFFLPTKISLENWQPAAFQAFYQGVLNSILALLCYNRAIRTLGATTSSAFLPLIPVCATLLAIPVLGEIPVLQEWLGVACAALGVLLATGTVSHWLRRRSA